MKKWKRTARYFYLRFIRLRGTPVEISRGFSIGVFWGMFPLPGLQMAVAVVTAAVFRGSKLAAAAGTWLSNPLTTIPITALNFQVGQWVRGREFSDLPSKGFESLDGFLHLGSEFITSFLLGCFITGSIAGIFSYFIGVPIISSFQKRAAQKRLKAQRMKRWRNGELGR